jgi:hypothetical protein
MIQPIQIPGTPVCFFCNFERLAQTKDLAAKSARDLYNYHRAFKEIWAWIECFSLRLLCFSPPLP